MQKAFGKVPSSELGEIGNLVLDAMRRVCEDNDKKKRARNMFPLSSKVAKGVSNATSGGKKKAPMVEYASPTQSDKVTASSTSPAVMDSSSSVLVPEEEGSFKKSPLGFARELSPLQLSISTSQPSSPRGGEGGTPESSIDPSFSPSALNFLSLQSSPQNQTSESRASSRGKRRSTTESPQSLQKYLSRSPGNWSTSPWKQAKNPKNDKTSPLQRTVNISSINMYQPARRTSAGVGYVCSKLGSSYSSEFSKFPFHVAMVPQVTMENYTRRLFQYTNCGQIALVASWILVLRSCLERPHMICSSTIHRLFFIAFSLYMKVYDDRYDDFYSNNFFAKLGGFELWQMNFLELEFCNMTDFRLVISAEQLDAHVAKLLRDREAKTFKLKFNRKNEDSLLADKMLRAMRLLAAECCDESTDDNEPESDGTSEGDY